MRQSCVSAFGCCVIPAAMMTGMNQIQQVSAGRIINYTPTTINSKGTSWIHTLDILFFNWALAWI